MSSEMYVKMASILESSKELGDFGYRRAFERGVFFAASMADDELTAWWEEDHGGATTMEAAAWWNGVRAMTDLRERLAK